MFAYISLPVYSFKNFIYKVPLKLQSKIYPGTCVNIEFRNQPNQGYVISISHTIDYKGTILSIDIIDEEQYRDPNVLKIIHDLKGDILYTSRSPVPFCETFNSNIGAKRIFGLFGFKWGYLKMFNRLDESPLEIIESCDSNRLYDNGYTQRIVPFPYINSYAVDVPEDIQKVEIIMKKDKYWKLYNTQ